MGPHASGCLETLSSWIVSEKAGQGEECSNFDILENNSCSHSEQTYIPESTKGINAWSSKKKTFYFHYSATSCFFATHQVGSDSCILLHQRKSNMTFHPFQISLRLKSKCNFSLVSVVCFQRVTRLKLEQTCTSRSSVNSSALLL